MSRLLAVLFLALLGYAGTATTTLVAGGTLSAQAGLDAPPLLTEPLSEAWRDKLLPPLLARLGRLGLYVPRESQAPTMPAVLSATPGALALVRRSTYEAAMANNQGLEFIEIGPAACLMLAVRADRPWRAYADLNYAKGPLRVVTSGPIATSLLDQLETDMPLGDRLTAIEERPLRVAFQRLVRGDAELVAFDAPRRSSAGMAAATAQLAAERGLRLLALPGPSNTGSLVMGEVQLEEASWFGGDPAMLSTLCDPFVLTLARSDADQLLFRLYEAQEAGLTASSSSRVESFVGQVQTAVTGLVTAIGLR